MIELITKMLLCLVAALILGLIIGWLLSKLTQSKKHHLELDVLSNTLDDRNSHIERLENQFAEKETVILQHSHENRVLKETLAKKDNHLAHIEKKLKESEMSINATVKLKSENENLLKQVNHLKDEVEAKERELQELETVLVKAERTIEDKNNLLSDNAKQLATFTSGVLGGATVASISKTEESKSEQALKDEIEKLTLVNDEKDNSISLYQNTISELEQELKLYSPNGEEDEFIISKDQFTHIEEQLIDYQKKINSLKEENTHLTQKINAISETKAERKEDDIAIVKLFRKTYKKITKS